jgi:malate dehydrogenase
VKYKVSVIGGAGNVGASVGVYMAEKNIADIVFIDIQDGVHEGKALDLTQTAPVRWSNARLTGSNDMAAIEGSDIVILTAGLPRKPGMSRSDLLKSNMGIVQPVSEAVKKHAPNCTFIVVTNPLDVMTYLAYKVTGFPKQRVMGMAGVLDSARMRAFISMELDVAAVDIQAMVLGGHGDSMVPLPRYTTVGGIPITELMPAEAIERISKRTRGGGGEIVKLLKTGSAFYAPAACTVEMASAILNDEKRMLPCSVYLDGEYGLKDVYIGVPVVLGSGGVEKVIELDLEADEKQALHTSAEAVKKDLAELELPVS